MYPKIIIEHFMKPKNVGKIKEPTSIGKAQTEEGTYVIFYFKVQDGKFSDIKYQVDGCPYAIACASIFSESAIGKDVEDFRNFNIGYFEHFFQIPQDKVNCILLIVNAINDAINKILSN